MKAFRLFILSLSFMILCAISASATTYYVSLSGSDTNTGSQAQPWRTIQHAVDTVSQGDTIVVTAGSYAGCRIGKSGIAASPITLRAESAGVVLINSLSPSNRHQSLIEIENFDATTRYWVIDGFEVAGAQRYGIDLRDTEYVTVQNCVVHNNTVTGILLAFSYHPLIQDNESYSNGEHGIYQSNSGDYPTIRRNNLHHNYAAGLHMNGDRNFTPGDGIISFAVVEKNIVWENGVGGGSGINCDGVSDSIIRNNLLYNNHASGISLYAIDGAEGSSRNRVYNNTIVMPSDGRWCVNIPASTEGQPNATGNQIRNNILYTSHTFRGSVSVWSNSVPGFSSDYNVVVNRFSIDGGGSNMTLAAWQALGYDQHSIVSTAEQVFSNPAGDDYSLGIGSPAIDAGMSLSTDVPDDLTGSARPRGRGYDIGCFESTGTAGGPTADFSGSPTSGAPPIAVQFTDLSTGGATGWSWDFGDGGVSSQQNPSHTYQTAGTFTVRLTATGSGGQNTRTRNGYITVSSAASPPTADFTANPTSGTAPLSVQFTDTSTGAPTTWSWDFGDGSTSSQQNPSHTYQGAGSFTVRLTAINGAGGNTRTRTSYISVSASTPQPVADFSANPTSGAAPLAVQFLNQSTGATSLSWNFGDGATSTETNPVHVYQGGGTFTVSLTASNASGQNTRTRTEYIVVTAPPSAPVAEFIAEPTTGTAPFIVHFTDQSSGSPSSWLWDFGDGGTSTQRNPLHTYTVAGSFTVRLVTSNAGGQSTRTRNSYVVVTPAAASDYFCSSMVIDLGKRMSGDHTSLHASDDVYVKLKAKELNGKFSDIVTCVFQTNLSSLSSLAITVEERSKVKPVRQQIFVFNPATSQWEQVDDRTLTSSVDTMSSVSLSNASKYLSSSGEVRVRIQTGDVAGGKWKHYLDLVKITAAP